MANLRSRLWRSLARGCCPLLVGVISERRRVPAIIAPLVLCDKTIKPQQIGGNAFVAISRADPSDEPFIAPIFSNLSAAWRIRSP
jgi:hypothetical protein